MSRDETAPVILSAVRTPIGKYLGGLAPLSAPKLGALVIREAVRRAGIEATLVEEVIMGNVLQGGVGQAPARQAAIHAGLPGTIPAMTVNKVCGSGLKAVNTQLVDGMINDGLWDSFSNTHMGNLAEYTAGKAHVSREDQDRFALA